MAAPKFSALLKKAYAHCSAKPFDCLLRNLFLEFKRRKCFTRLTSNSAGRFDWPSAHGVYVIRKRSGGPAVYVGLAGRLKNSGLFDTKSGLSKRVYRSTPYRFDPSGKRLRYNPSTPSSGVKAQPLAKQYRSSVFLKSLVIDCFTFGARDRIAPAVLEALLLQMHLEQYCRLPKANRQF